MAVREAIRADKSQLSGPEIFESRGRSSVNAVEGPVTCSKVYSLQQLLSIANGSCRFPAPVWRKLVHSFGPEHALWLLATAPAERDAVSVFPALRDPFVSALRRVFWPSARLSVRHRRALRKVGHEPLGLVWLAVEEARTAAWRSFDRSLLRDLAAWLARFPLRAIDRKASVDLLATVRTYNALYSVAFEARDDYLPAVRQVAEILKEHPASGSIVVEALFSRALLAARMNDEVKVQECLREAEAAIYRCDEEDQHELLVWLGVIRAMAVDYLAGDPLRADELRIQTLKTCDDRSDPWLPLFLHHEAARAALLDVCQIWTELGKRRTICFQPRFFRQAASRPDRMGHALAHLEAAEKRFRELVTGSFAVNHLSLHGHALVLEDPVKGLDLLLEALNFAVQGWNPEEATRVAATLSFFVKNLSEAGLPQKCIEVCAEKAREALANARAVQEWRRQ